MSSPINNKPKNELNDFIDKFVFGAPLRSLVSLIGRLAGRAVTYLREALGLTKKTQEVAQNVFEAQPTVPEAKAIEQYNVSIDVENIERSCIIGEGRNYLNNRAPYLFNDLKMPDGSPIALKEGDYLISTSVEGIGEILLPGSLIEGQQRLKLTYKDQPIQLTFPENLLLMTDAAKIFLYETNGGLPNDPVEIEQGSNLYVAIDKAKRYLHPDRIKRRNELVAQAAEIKNACVSNKGTKHYRLMGDKCIKMDGITFPELPNPSIQEAQPFKHELKLHLPDFKNIDLYESGDTLVIIGTDSPWLKQEVMNIPGEPYQQVYIFDMTYRFFFLNKARREGDYIIIPASPFF